MIIPDFSLENFQVRAYGKKTQAETGRLSGLRRWFWEKENQGGEISKNCVPERRQWHSKRVPEIVKDAT